MEPFDEIKKYSSIVCEQVRWKKARNVIGKEIENHICDQRDVYVAEGMDETTATHNAILQMGDAVSIGLEFDKMHRPKTQWTMILLVGIFMVISIVTSYFMDMSQYSYHDFNIIPYMIACILFFAFYFMDFRMVRTYAIPCYFIVLFSSIVGLLLNKEINGKTSWIIGNISEELSYLFLIFSVIFSLFLYTMRRKGYLGILLCGIAYLPLAIILCIVSATTGLVIFTISALVMLCFSIIKGWFGVRKRQGLCLVLIPTIIASIFLCTQFPRSMYIFERIQIAFNPYSSEKGYQQRVIRDILEHASLIGKGSISPEFGENILQTPVANTNYTLLLLIHNFGWIVLIGICLISIIFAGIGFYKITKQKSIFSILVSLSVMIPFVLQFMFYTINNIGYGILYSSSFLLYEKIPFIIHITLIGFMLSVFRMDSIIMDKAKRPFANHIIFSYKDGRLVIDFKGSHV